MDKTDWVDGRPVPVIVCAAIRVGDLVVCGARHFDKIMHGVIQAANWDMANAEQGFIDQYGMFYNRGDAMKVAKAAGQQVDIERGCGGHEDTLFSEGLY